jgi:3-oxoacyl-[acyl-carrier protein] reductase
MSQRAVVTGSSSGIGAAVATRLLAEGWQVVGLDIAPAPAPLRAEERFNEHRVDLTDVAARRAALYRLLQAGAPDALVHCAGVLRTAPLGGLDGDDGALMWRLHVEAATALAGALLPAMARAGRGRVVLIGSRIAAGMPGRSQYAATKAALVSLARSWAAEVVTQGVTVNVVSPAATETPMLSDPGRAGSAPRVTPIGRLIRADEVAALVAYLLGPNAEAITGQDIAVCGGASLPR